MLDAGSGSSACGTGVSVFQYRFVGTWSTADQNAFITGVERWDNVRDRNNNIFIDSNRVFSGGVPVSRDTSAGSATTCTGGVPTAMVIGGTNVARSATHEAGHAHGLSHTGNDDALDPTSGAQGTQPSMDGCAASTTGAVTSDDRLQYAHERDLQTFTQSVGFENGSTGWTGYIQPATGSPNTGSRFMKVTQGNTLFSAFARVTTPPGALSAQTDFKGGGTNRLKFQYREVNYPAPNACNTSSQPAFNPNTHSWRDPTLGAFDTEVHDLPQSPAAWAKHTWTLPVVWAGWEAFDYRLHAYSQTGGDLFIDDLELT